MTRPANVSRDEQPPPGTPGAAVLPRSGDPGIDAKVAFLRRRASYPDGSGDVTALETHMSWVFLTEHQAWKLRKPVCYGYLDFSTLAARRHDCDEEVRLNRRLTRDVYQGIVPLTRDAAGELRLDGDGETVDWLVKMRRLPAERMLDNVLRAGTVDAADLERVVAALARAYRAMPPVAITPADYRQRLADDIADNRRELSLPEWRLPQEDITAACTRQQAFLDTCSALFDTRVREGWIVEGHGDLRPEHICLEAEPQIIDCLEFARDLRIADAADELAYLALECERLGAPALAPVIFAAWKAETGDAPPDALLHFYRSYRACVRAKIAIWHWREPALRGLPKWSARARDYLRLAREHSANCA